MNFKPHWDAKTRIELLERWILVQSYIYYELNDNCASDFDYDNNVRQLFELIKNNPDDHHNSRYYLYFDKFEPGCTSGFELLEKVRKKNKALYDILYRDAQLALDAKYRRFRQNEGQ